MRHEGDHDLDAVDLHEALDHVEPDGVIEPGTFNVIPAGQLHGPFEADQDTIQFKVFSSLPVYILADGSVHIYKRDGKTIAAGSLDFVRELAGANFVAD